MNLCFLKNCLNNIVQLLFIFTINHYLNKKSYCKLSKFIIFFQLYSSVRRSLIKFLRVVTLYETWHVKTRCFENFLRISHVTLRRLSLPDLYGFLLLYQMQDRIINLNPIARQEQMKSHYQNNFKINEYKYKTWGGNNWLFNSKSINCV